MAVIVDGERIGALTAAVASQCDCTVLRASSTRLPVSLSAITNSSTAATGRSLNCAVNSAGRRLATPWRHTYYMRMHSINTQHTRIQPHTHTHTRARGRERATAFPDSRRSALTEVLVTTNNRGSCTTAHNAMTRSATLSSRRRQMMSSSDSDVLRSITNSHIPSSARTTNMDTRQQ